MDTARKFLKRRLQLISTAWFWIKGAHLKIRNQGWFKFLIVLLGAFLFGLTVDYLFALAGVHFIRLWWDPILIEPIAEPGRGHVVSGIFALIGGAIALGTYYKTFHQKQDHFEKQRKQEQAQADYDAIAAEYDALSKDFVAEKELARINAAIGLATIAMKADPRRQLSSEELQNAEKDTALYPWYERISMQLASALIIYEEPRARDQVLKSIREIARFDAKPGPQPLLTFLINTLADSNRTAYNTFLITFAEGMSCGDHGHIGTYARAVSIYPTFSENFVMLKGLLEEEDFENLLAAERDVRKFSKHIPKSGDPDDKFLRRLSIAAQQLVNTRDAIADCVSDEVRKVGVEIPELNERVWQNNFNDEEFEIWQKDFKERMENISRLYLQNCFLQDATLAGAQLQRAHLYSAFIEDANLFNAALQGSFMRNARLNRCLMYGVKAEGADLQEANFQDANIGFCSFRGANFHDAILSNQKMVAVQFQGAYLFRTQFDSAEFFDVQLQGAKLYLVNFGDQVNGNLCKNVLWKHSDLRFYISKIDQKWTRTSKRVGELIKFLRTNFPEGGPQEGQTWPDDLIHEEDYAEPSAVSEAPAVDLTPSAPESEPQVSEKAEPEAPTE